MSQAPPADAYWTLLKSLESSIPQSAHRRIACAFARLVWDDLPKKVQQALLAAERYAEGRGTIRTCQRHREIVKGLLAQESDDRPSPLSPVHWALAESYASYPAWYHAQLAGSNILHLQAATPATLCAVVQAVAKEELGCPPRLGPFEPYPTPKEGPISFPKWFPHKLRARAFKGGHHWPAWSFQDLPAALEALASLEVAIFSGHLTVGIRGRASNCFETAKGVHFYDFRFEKARGERWSTYVKRTCDETAERARTYRRPRGRILNPEPYLAGFTLAWETREEHDRWERQMRKSGQP